MLFNVELLVNYFNLGSFLLIYLISPQLLCAYNTALVSVFAFLVIYTWVTRGQEIGDNQLEVSALF